MKFLENIIIILKGIVISILSKKKTTIPNEEQSNKDNNNIVNADNKQSVYGESAVNDTVPENKELPSLNTKESIVTESLSQANNIKTEPIIKFFRKANNDGIFLRISDKQEVQSWFKVVFKDEALKEGEYSVIEDKIINGILPNDYKSSIHIDNTLYGNNDTLKVCKTLQKGFVNRKTDQEWQIKQILKIQIQ